MYQGSHLPNFEALGVPNSKRQTRTHTQTDGRTTPHESIMKVFSSKILHKKHLAVKQKG